MKKFPLRCRLFSFILFFFSFCRLTYTRTRIFETRYIVGKEISFLFSFLSFVFKHREQVEGNSFGTVIIKEKNKERSGEEWYGGE